MDVHPIKLKSKRRVTFRTPTSFRYKRYEELQRRERKDRFSISVRKKRNN